MIISPVILLYDSRGAVDRLSSAEREHVTENLDRLPDVPAVVFHVPSAPDIDSIPKREGQIWIAWSMESDVYYPQLSNVEYMRHFDLTMTYRLDSDSPCPYFGADMEEALLRPPIPKHGGAPAVFIASNPFDKSGRIGYVRELMRYLQVDSYGQCLNNRTLPDDTGKQAKLDTITKYKFTFAFENSQARDYVTEKFFDPLIAGSVPVYLGAANIEEFAPAEHCYIDVARFQNARRLADYLAYLAANETEYESYLAWKRNPLAPAFLEKTSGFREAPFCRLNAMLRGRDAGSAITNLQCDPLHKVLRWFNASMDSSLPIRSGARRTDPDATPESPESTR